MKNVTLGVLLMLVIGTAAAGQSSSSENNARRRLVRQVLPTYPPSLLKHRITGVTVAEVFIEPRGSVKEIHILQSPHPMISIAVVDALGHWLFTPSDSQRSMARILKTKLTFYFDVVNGNGRVLNPSDVPNKR
jgi:outer membrane biosynthesis protein TonB